MDDGCANGGDGGVDGRTEDERDGGDVSGGDGVVVSSGERDRVVVSSGERDGVVVSDDKCDGGVLKCKDDKCDGVYDVDGGGDGGE